ncbi:hypothetical protein BDZ91DRAFT_833732 [Kalaharituber pfeilii]|nr:hypothetical protein BDZ91DRAFT_833732 [Kalaharituber pfeilii]
MRARPGWLAGLAGWLAGWLAGCSQGEGRLGRNGDDVQACCQTGQASAKHTNALAAFPPGPRFSQRFGERNSAILEVNNGSRPSSTRLALAARPAIGPAGQRNSTAYMSEGGTRAAFNLCRLAAALLGLAGEAVLREACGLSAAGGGEGPLRREIHAQFGPPGQVDERDPLDTPRAAWLAASLRAATQNVRGRVGGLGVGFAREATPSEGRIAAITQNDHHQKPGRVSTGKLVEWHQHPSPPKTLRQRCIVPAAVPPYPVDVEHKSEITMQCRAVPRRLPITQRWAATEWTLGSVRQAPGLARPHGCNCYTRRAACIIIAA